jgi:hypothetical protein
MLILEINLHVTWNSAFIDAEQLNDYCRFFWDSRPVIACAHQRDSRKHLLESNRVIRAVIHICATLRSSTSVLRKKKYFERISKEKSHKVVTFHVYVGAPLFSRLQWKFAHLSRLPA